MRSTGERALSVCCSIYDSNILWHMKNELLPVSNLAKGAYPQRKTLARKTNMDNQDYVKSRIIRISF